MSTWIPYNNLVPALTYLKHLLDQHESENFADIDFRMQVISYPRSAYERQILEAVLIQQNRHHYLLNSRSEFNRSAIPRLSMRLGEKEFSQRVKEEKLEDEKEENLKSRIRDLRKQRNRERGGGQRGAPGRKTPLKMKSS